MALETVAHRLRIALELADTGLSLMRQNLRRANPDASEAEIEVLFCEWLVDRPGARHGDCSGDVRAITLAL